MTDFGDVLTNTTLTRMVHLSGAAFGKGVTAPDDVVVGTSPAVPAILMDATAETLAIYASLPPDADLTQDVILRLQWGLVNVQLNGDVLNIDCNYVAPTLAGAAGVDKTSTLTTGVVTAVTGRLAINDMYSMDITFDAGDGTNPLASAVGIGLEINLNNLTGIAAAHLFDGDIIYEALY